MKFLITQLYRILTDCEKKILIEADSGEQALELYAKEGDEVGEIIFDDEYDCELYDLGSVEIEFYPGREDGN